MEEEETKGGKKGGVSLVSRTLRPCPETETLGGNTKTRWGFQ